MKHLRKPAVAKPLRPAPPRQLMIAFESPQLWRMNTPERRRIVACLANLLMQAAGSATEESSDDKR